MVEPSLSPMHSRPCTIAPMPLREDGVCAPSQTSAILYCPIFHMKEKASISSSGTRNHFSSSIFLSENLVERTFFCSNSSGTEFVGGTSLCDLLEREGRKYSNVIAMP